MATQTDQTFTMLAGATVVAYRLVKKSANTVILNTVVSTDEPIGIVQPAVDGIYTSGAALAIRDIKTGGTGKVMAAGVIAAGADIYAAAVGKVSALPAGAGTYRKVGFAREASAADGQIIEGYFYPCGSEVTVSQS